MGDVIEMKAKTSSAPRRSAPTERGERVIAAVTQAARELLSTQWLHETTVVQVADRADVARASLLYQFPGGLLEICEEIRSGELAALDGGYEAAGSLPTRDRSGRLMAFAAPLLERARRAGRLYSNLRSATFNGAVAFEGVSESVVQDHIDDAAELLGGGDKSDVGYCLASAWFSALLDAAADIGVSPRNAEAIRERMHLVSESFVARVRSK